MLSEQTKVSIAITPANGAAASTDVEGATLDMSGFEGVLMIVTMGVIDGSAVTSIKAQQDSAANMGTVADIAGTAQAIADNDDNKTFYIDLYRPTERYVRLHVDRATQNATVASAIYIQYGPRKSVTTHGSNVSGEAFAGPAEGTA